MPSPFPGMDPFLEHPAWFPDLHDCFITHLREAVQARLPEPYYAVMGRRVWVELSGRHIGPDVTVVRPRSPRAVRDNGGGVAVATPVRIKPRKAKPLDDEQREIFIEIRKHRGRLVASIEVLSPANKSPGEEARELYQRKQRELLSSQVHLIEIDLLRGGEHATAVAREDAVCDAGSFDYHICVHRFDVPDDYFIYPVQLSRSLPVIEVPLLPSDGEIPLALQDVFDRSYDAGPYRRQVNYAELDLVPPLRPEQLEWAKGILAEKGLLSTPQAAATGGSR